MSHSASTLSAAGHAGLIHRRLASSRLAIVSSVPGLMLAAGIAGLSGCEWNVQTDPGIEAALSTVDKGRLRDHVSTLTRFGPRPAGDAQATERTLTYLAPTLRNMGNHVVQEPVTSEGASRQQFNLVVEYGPAASEPGVLEIGAHYDTVDNSPGADDNASGVAALLEIARVLIEHPPVRKVRLIFFAAEESGRFGSETHVTRVLERGERLAGTIVLEMIGYTSHGPGTQRTPARIPLLFWPPDRGDFIAVVGNFTSGWLGNRFESAAERYVSGLGYFSANRLGGLFKDALRSDHKPYWDAGMTAVLLTDTADFRNPHYHAPDDLPETLDYDFLAAVTRATLATALLWAQDTAHE